MEWFVGITMLITGFLLDRIYEWYKKRKAGLTGQAHDIIARLGASVQSFTGNDFLSNNPTDNFRITRHVYEHATGDVIGTCFRENPICYGEQDLARLLPKGASFARLTTDNVCPEADRTKAEAMLKELVPNARIVNVSSVDYFTSIDGIFTELSDGTHIAFVTFPKTGTEDHNRGIVFYGHTAKAFFEYFRDLRDVSESVLGQRTEAESAANSLGG
uniref:Uncharacterized protein n=1 Tax=Candidatus Kentrum sp. MB TaxID=2138164 RepID=A0A451BAT9_9GAMM|nr:MAG: hypothetical protein BECKMB1821G_GA0114241_10248 [Candidatus Kentron sp. MB]VFK31168.1 MAG: hypothetical protein BECKMB1821I_GA0114274_10217 [Candidatus Kentron sp. MB]VFK75374.1 MAG: hypothetical protein BECKMB1821H_GA0114242_10218 [Candidatus Kentron sp. MB]